MGLLKHLIKSVYDFYIPKTDKKNSIAFNSDDPPSVWKPLVGLDLLDRAGTQDFYRSFAYACINKKAYNTANANIYLYRQFKSRRTEITDHPFMKLLRSRNSYGQSFKEMLFLSSVNCDLNGNAYLMVNRVEFLGKRLPVQ